MSPVSVPSTCSPMPCHLAQAADAIPAATSSTASPSLAQLRISRASATEDSTIDWTTADPSSFPQAANTSLARTSPTSPHRHLQSSFGHSSSALLRNAARFSTAASTSANSTNPEANYVHAPIPLLSTFDHITIVIAITASFVTVIIVTRSFRHQQHADHRPAPYQPIILPAAAMFSADRNRNQPPLPPAVCSMEYSAATSRLRFADVKLHDRSVLALIDTAAEVSIVRPSIANELWLPFEAAPGRSYGKTASGGLLFFSGATSTSLSIAGQSIQHRFLVPTTDDIPAQLIIGLDLLSSLAQPVSFNFIDNYLNIANVPVQLYEMPSTPRARNFVPAAFGVPLRVRSLIDEDCIPIPNTPLPRPISPIDVTSSSTFTDYIAATQHRSPRSSPSTNYNAGRQKPPSVQPTLFSSSESLFIFDAMINGIQTRAAFNSNFPACRCRLSFCLDARLQFSR